MIEFIAYKHVTTAPGHIQLGMDVELEPKAARIARRSLQWHRSKDPRNGTDPVFVSRTLALRRHDWKSCPYVEVSMDETGRIHSVRHPETQEELFILQVT